MLEAIVQKYQDSPSLAQQRIDLQTHASDNLKEIVDGRIKDADRVKSIWKKGHRSTFLFYGIASFSYIGYLFFNPEKQETLQYMGNVAALEGYLLMVYAQEYIFTRFQEEEKLISTGMYSSTRNPIYLGLRITSLGMLASTQSLLDLCLCIGVFAGTEVTARLEEARTTVLFGKEAVEYQQKVPRWFSYEHNIKPIFGKLFVSVKQNI